MIADVRGWWRLRSAPGGRPILKVCCIQSQTEAAVARAAGAELLGLVATMPSGPGPLPDASIAQIAAKAPVGAVVVLLTAESTAAGIVAHAQKTGSGRCSSSAPPRPTSFGRCERRRSPIPILLAGGIGPDNVARALFEVRPAGIDPCRGIRDDRDLDVERLRALVEQMEPSRKSRVQARCSNAHYEAHLAELYAWTVGGETGGRSGPAPTRS